MTGLAHLRALTTTLREASSWLTCLSKQAHSAEHMRAILDSQRGVDAIADRIPALLDRIARLERAAEAADKYNSETDYFRRCSRGFELAEALAALKGTP